MKISKHFKLEEFACHDGTPYPRKWIKSRLKPLVEQLEKIRSAFGDKPITITSGYRTPDYNRKVGGARFSQHKEGRAADIKIKGVRARQVAKKIRQMIREGDIMVGGVGSYRSFTHYDLRGRKANWNF